MDLPQNIEIRPAVMMGKPCVKGTRIPVHLILEKLRGGETAEEILSAYPQLTDDHITAALQFSNSIERKYDRHDRCKIEARLRGKAEAEGITVSAYIERLVRADVAAEEELENLALQGLNSAALLDVGPGYWEEKHRRLREQGEDGTRILFPSARGGRLSADAVQYLVAKHATAARQFCPSLADKHVSPHVCATRPQWNCCRPA